MFASLKQFGKELASIGRNPKVLIPVIAVLMVPVMYTAMFLGAFWDPYGRLEDLPVAVVNEDKGAEFNGKQLKIGEEFAGQLKENRQFDWRFVTKEEAKAGLENNTYYMAIEIPEDFSEKTTTLTSDHPTAAKLKFLQNEGYNFLASQIGNSAVEKMKAMLNKEVTQAYARAVFEQLGEMAGGISAASEGAGQLADGTAQAKDGMAQLVRHLNRLASGSVSLQDGVAELRKGGAGLNDGAASLRDGANGLATGLDSLYEAHGQLESGAASLRTGAESLHGGAAELSAGLDQLAKAGGQLVAGASDAEQASGRLAQGLAQLTDASAKLEAGSDSLAQGLARLAEANDQLAESEEFQALLAAGKQLAAGAADAKQAQQQLSGGAEELHNGLAELTNGLSAFDGKLKEAQAGGRKLAEGGKTLSAGTERLAAGMKQFGGKLAEARDGGKSLAAGAQQLAGGAGKLEQGLNSLASSVVPFVDGSEQLESGAKQVFSGLIKLDDGTHELSGKLGNAASKASDLHVSDAMYDMFAEPIELDVQKVSEVPNYGTGFAPYFLSLGLYVGALLLSIVYTMREPAVPPVNGRSWFISKALTVAAVGIIQALIADAVLLWVLGLEVKSVPLFILFSIITSLTYMMLILFLVTTMQHPGRFIAIVLLILQLTSSAGTFPLELIPGWLQHVTPWLPMTYSVAGLKDVISSGDFGSMWTQASWLGVFAASFAAMTLVYFVMAHRSSRRSASEDHTSAAI